MHACNVVADIGVPLKNHGGIFCISFINVCHSSAFQIITRRSVYIKIINYNDSISATVNKTMQTKQHAVKKPHFYSIETRFTRKYFLWWNDFEQKMFKIFSFC